MISRLKPAIVLFMLSSIQPVSPGRNPVPVQTAYVGTRKDSSQSKTRLPASNPDLAESTPQCEIKGTKALTISCTYTPSRLAASDLKNVARIVLDRAEISFEPDHESDMIVELEFTNDGRSSLTSASPVYLAIDDDAGRNAIRRVLPHVDLLKLHPGEHLRFSERFLVGAFTGGHYTISLWIPDPDPSRKNTPANNLLLSSVGVPDPTTGLNIVAHFSIAPSMHSSGDK